MSGELLAEDIDDYIENWHQSPERQEIYEFLDMSKEEYSLWLRAPDALPLIARARLTSATLADVIRATLKGWPIAARSADATKVKRLMGWLENAGNSEPE